MAKNKTFIPFGTLETGTLPKVRRISPDSEEGKRIFNQMLAELPADFGHLKKKHASFNYPSRVKDRVIKAWEEEKVLSLWLKDQRCVCKSRRALLNRLKGGWTGERAMSTPYGGLFVA